MLIDPDKSLLLMIDMQEKLLPAIAGHETLISNCRWLLDVALSLEVPVLATEQYPQGIGHTAASLRARLPADKILAKSYFSCMSEPGCRETISARRPEQVVMIGIEAHVCILQSAIQLRQQAPEVYVVADCVASRNPEDRRLALERMRQCGIHIVSREMVAFEWMRKAGTDSFRHISRNFLR